MLVVLISFERFTYPNLEKEIHMHCKLHTNIIFNFVVRNIQIRNVIIMEDLLLFLKWSSYFHVNICARVMNRLGRNPVESGENRIYSAVYINRVFEDGEMKEKGCEQIVLNEIITDNFR